MSDEAGAGQFHFDPATYLAMMLAEVPAYRDLQRHVAEATRGSTRRHPRAGRGDGRDGIGGAGRASRRPAPAYR